MHVISQSLWLILRSGQFSKPRSYIWQLLSRETFSCIAVLYLFPGRSIAERFIPENIPEIIPADGRNECTEEGTFSISLSILYLDSLLIWFTD
jgi:hypothetical protein